MHYDEQVGKILDQNRIINEILQHLEKFDVFLIQGERGNGKTFLANEFINKIHIEIPIYKCHILDNEKKININMYEPFFKIIKDKSTLNENLKEQIINIAQENKLTRIISNIFKIFSREQLQTKFESFSDEEMKLVLFFSNEIKNKKVIWVCDNIHLWSDDAKKLLLSIIRYKDKFNGLRNLKFIILADVQCNYFDEDCNLKFKLAQFDKNDFNEIVSLIHPDIVNLCKKSELIYNISNHNLKIANELSEIIKDEDNINFNSLRELVLNHFRTNIEDGLNILSFLEKVAFLGETTLKRLLELFLETEEILNNEYLIKSLSMKILDNEDENIKFINTVIYDSVANSIDDIEKRRDHKKLAACISILFPSDYITRAKHLLYANEKEQSKIYYILHSLQYYRKNKKEIQNIDSHFEFFEIDKNLISFYEKIVSLYKSYYNNNLKKDSLEENLIAIQPWISGINELKFEMDYIKALYYINFSYKRNDFNTAKKILNGWYENSTFKESNCEMWIRATMLLMDVYSELDDVLWSSFFVTLRPNFCYRVYATP